jgi:hypothetical protein
MSEFIKNHPIIAAGLASGALGLAGAGISEYITDGRGTRLQADRDRQFYAGTYNQPSYSQPTPIGFI